MGSFKWPHLDNELCAGNIRFSHPNNTVNLDTHQQHKEHLINYCIVRPTLPHDTHRSRARILSQSALHPYKTSTPPSPELVGMQHGGQVEERGCSLLVAVDVYHDYVMRGGVRDGGDEPKKERRSKIYNFENTSYKTWDYNIKTII